MEEEYMPTGHHVYSGMGFGRQRMHNEVVAKEMKPFVISQPEAPAPPSPTAPAEAPEEEAMETSAVPDAEMEEPAPIWEEEQDKDSEDEAIDDYGEADPEDIAARIASDRTQNQADILEVARQQAEADDTMESEET